MQTCPSCGQENPDGFRLCGMCGAALAAAAAAREERKVVTILFTDLVGSTAKAEQLDPEDVRAILSPYYSRLRDEIERHGGTVEKFIGDAVMAVFGAPVAHEDDPERAVRAALAIREAIGGDLQIRTAVNTGEALVALGAPREALAELEPLMGDKNIAGMADFTSPAPLLLVELGREDLYADVLATTERPSDWHRAAAHVVAGDFDRAADVYAEIGARFLEAWSRLLAAEHGAPGQADRAHAHFAAEEASWFVGRCAALLPASA